MNRFWFSCPLAVLLLAIALGGAGCADSLDEVSDGVFDDAGFGDAVVTPDAPLGAVDSAPTVDTRAADPPPMVSDALLPSDAPVGAVDVPDAPLVDAPLQAGDAPVVDAVDAVSTDGAACDKPVCPPGLKRCRDQCVSVENPWKGCGAIGCDACEIPNAVAGCQGGACSVRQCLNGWADCNKDPKDGCEVELSTTANCGGCGMACSSGQKCSKGQCMDSCPLDETDCNGTCVDLAFSANHCGTCERKCGFPVPLRPHVPACSKGVCVESCGLPFTKCGGECADLTWPQYGGGCGQCGQICPIRDRFGATCVSGACLPCPAGQEGCDGTCTPTKVHAKHCGACGNFCPNGAICVEGRCEDRLIRENAFPDDMALDDTWIYYVSAARGVVERVKKSGGPVEVLADKQPEPHRLAVDATHVYFSNRFGAVMRVGKSGGDAAPFAPANRPGGIALDDQYVYYANGGTKQIVRIPKAGGTAVPISTLTGTPTELVFDGHTLNFVTFDISDSQKRDAMLGWIPVTGGPAHIVAQGEPCASRRLAGDADTIYWQCGTVRATRKMAPFTTVVLGTGSLVVSENAQVYFTKDRNLFRKATDTCEEPVTVASVQQVLDLSVSDATSVYTVGLFEGRYSIYRLPK